LTRITIAGAVGAALHIGKGDPDKVDQTTIQQVLEKLGERFKPVKE
jgi:fructose-1,6-bisphosphatase/sedoheptulose 1,7-bisphosphatase-like protein